MRSTLGHKIWMACTGAFLCFFLVIHLLGNFQLLLPLPQARIQFNWYSHLLSGNFIIKLISYVLYLSIIVHVVYAILITGRNRRASGKGYAVDKRRAVSTWQSRNMGLLGTIILIFLVIHFKDFWYQYMFKTLPVDEKGHKDLYAIVVAVFKQGWYVMLYEVSLLALGFHLLHGFYSAARTFGLYHPRYLRMVRVTGWLYTAVITLGFMAMPLYIYFS